jgi:hypothetical protein
VCPNRVSQAIIKVQRGIYPSLIREDPGQKSSPSIEVRSFGDNGSRHRIISSNSNAHDHSKAEYPDHFQCWSGYAVWQTDDQNCTNDTNDEFLSVNELTAKGITKKSKRELTDNIADVRCSVYCSSKEGWVMAIPVPWWGQLKLIT